MGQARTGKNSGARNGRVIMHLDMDAFFVNVELLENPALRGTPIIVAPLGPRSVVCSASYEARAHGVRSGMPLSRAQNLSPNATVLPLRGDYRHYSRAVMGILHDLSPYVEQVSVDEAFVDLTGAYLHGQDPVALAQSARDRIAQELSLPSSAGVAPNKLLAKMASTGSKPNGLWVIPPERVQEFLDPRKVSDLWGVGAKSTDQLSRYGIHTIAQMRSMSLDWLKERFGTAQGEHLWAMARGIDERPVITEREEKSMGGEHTFETDTTDAREVSAAIRELSLKLGKRLRTAGKLAGGLSLKIRYSTFETHTRAIALNVPVDSGMQIASLALEALRADGILVGQDAPCALRLIGVRAEKLARAEDGVQQTLFDSIESGASSRSAQTSSAKITSAQTASAQTVSAQTVSAQTVSAQRGGGGGAGNMGSGARSGSGARLVKSGRWSEVEHVMDAIHRKYSQESLKPASGVTAPEKNIEEKNIEEKSHNKE
ncbi:DNA polymerase IV [uncultured Rothia sp.]|uniref:DNA polymerase IV n=1 Tax=uncultured Rothia sp. TaxID=316088 RepID=UPI0025D5AEBA|nr:DNA polymerase IV [uncultured Rothia sp.]